jgi:hypothetical protein
MFQYDLLVRLDTEYSGVQIAAWELNADARARVISLRHIGSKDARSKRLVSRFNYFLIPVGNLSFESVFKHIGFAKNASCGHTRGRTRGLHFGRYIKMEWGWGGRGSKVYGYIFVGIIKYDPSNDKLLHGVFKQWSVCFSMICSSDWTQSIRAYK